ncbi:type II toxin-antitoxin system Phd/YefM family antitoxin [Marinomonas sp. 2405UD68-3]|uniref:type II toxin-antitoxin system Phd/YefM family antitoxin n=1 Tax=Marinomonas sp. 2405UD68-3 TaxID=3391835 RepID=UPI0039C9223C
MTAIRTILAENSTSISELKKNPMAVIEGGQGFPVLVLNRNQPAFYCVPAAAYEEMMNKLEDIELAQLVMQRTNSKEVEIDLNEL